MGKRVEAGGRALEWRETRHRCWSTETAGFRADVEQDNVVGNYGWRVIVDLKGRSYEVASGFMPGSFEEAAEVAQVVGVLLGKRQWTWRE